MRCIFYKTVMSTPGSSNWYQCKGCEELINKKNTIKRGMRRFDYRSYKKKERN
ncbi:hypothetical protein HanXRQr2_Chr07g0310721 [Helianthus annuus]|uniref:Uncharacterized protein n=1 Tax=Helianthus annuus TaxID=4232 RepID=A0A251UE86_HELAN|nr:hypothetical protein HanXRQr2_Chr07g0310721 [Helianthus annuus]